MNVKRAIKILEGKSNVQQIRIGISVLG